MSNGNSKKPVVLVLAGHDPGGGAGIQADIETLAANGCHAATVITCLTTQNTAEFGKTIPVNPVDFGQQIEFILDDMQINACKIGLITDFSVLTLIIMNLHRLNGIPVVFDPVIHAGAGGRIMPEDVITPLREKLLPLITVLTPNSPEARALTGMDNLTDAGNDLLKQGCRAVLITGTHEQTDAVVNTLHVKDHKPVEFNWERLPGVYHGSGCTLSSSIAAQLAQGETIVSAVENAQEYTWQTLKHAIKLGRQQLHPNRFYRFS